MAHTIDAMPRRKGRARKGTYAWDKWLNGEVWVLVQGEDFTGTLAGMRSGAYSAAHRRGLGLSTAIQDGNLIVQAVN